MELTFNSNKTVLVKDAHLIFKNFKGESSAYNKAGEKKFNILIDNQECADALMNDTNQYGVPWNVHVKAPKEEGDIPFMHLPVKLSYNGRRGPNVYLVTNGVTNTLDESTIGLLDDIDIEYVELIIRPYDGELGTGAKFRAAYLQSMKVVQRLDSIQAEMQGLPVSDVEPF